MARTVKFTYATHVDGGGQPYPASRDATTPFSFWLLIAHDIAQGIQRGKRLVGDTLGHPR